MRQHKHSYTISALLAVAIWASAFVAIRESLIEFAPGELVLFRWWIATGLMGLLYLSFKHFNHDYQPAKLKARLGSALVGIIGMGLYTLFLSIGEQTVFSGTASFIIAQAPVIVAIIARVFLKEHLCIRRLFGILISLAGVSLIACSNEGDAHLSNQLSNPDILFVIAAAVCSGIYTVLQKYVVNNIHPIELSFWATLAAAVSLTPLNLLPLIHHLPKIDTPELMSAIYLGVGPGSAFLLWAYATSGMSATRTASFAYFMPIISVLFGWMFLSEVPSMGVLTGGGIAVLGAVLVNHRFKKPITLQP